jgi:hypothetical protein
MFLNRPCQLSKRLPKPCQRLDREGCAQLHKTPWFSFFRPHRSWEHRELVPPACPSVPGVQVQDRVERHMYLTLYYLFIFVRIYVCRRGQVYFSPAMKLLNFSLGFEALQSLEQLADDVDQVPWDPRRPAMDMDPPFVGI